MAEPVILEGALVRLEPLDLRHAGELFEIGQEESIWLYMPQPMFQTESDTEDWIREALRAQDAGNQLPFAIIEKNTGRAIGSTRYLNIRPEHKCIEVGWSWLGKAWRRTGINTECKFLLFHYAFEKLNCVRVELKTDTRNVQSQRAMERIGCVREGILRKHMILWDGFVRDTVYYSVIADEWPQVKSKLQALMRR